MCCVLYYSAAAVKLRLARSCFLKCRCCQYFAYILNLCTMSLKWENGFCHKIFSQMQVFPILCVHCEFVYNVFTMRKWLLPQNIFSNAGVANTLRTFCLGPTLNLVSLLPRCYQLGPEDVHLVNWQNLLLLVMGTLSLLALWLFPGNVGVCLVNFEH